ncbi:MAG: sulfotransferase [Pseudomonadota bacterium]
MTENAQLQDLLDQGAKLYGAGHTAAAAKIYRRALKIAPKDPTVRLRHATAIWHGENRAEEALAEIRDLCRAYPQAVLYATEGMILSSLGRFAEAAVAARAALKADPSHSSAWLDLATAVEVDDAPAAIDELRVVLSDPQATPKMRRDMHFALARLLRKTGDQDAAFAQTVAANNLVDQTWSAKTELGFRIELRAIFTPDLIQQRHGEGLLDDRMVFIVGMPRSGTTILERMLLAHPDVGSAGETTAVGRTFLQLRDQVGGTIDGVRKNLSPGNLQAMAKAVLNDVEARLGAARPKRIIDKMPANYLFVPLIGLTLPNARIIHMQRHPLDTGLSCFEAHFAFGLDYAARLDSLGEAYRMYADLMEDWRELPQPKIHRICYERLVADTEAEMRALLAHCGLPWDPACLHPSQSGAIKTASIDQARSDLNDRSVGRWRDHADRLSPLIDAMGGMDWVERQSK